MRAFIQALRLTLLTFATFLLCSGSSSANHLFGGELYYTYQSGKLYKVTMVLYADCSGPSSVLGSLPTASPEILVTDSGRVVRTMQLKIQPGSDTDVTPVCPADVNNTTCRSASGTVPGVKRFIYADTISLSTSADWKFHFTGALGGTSAGRSTSLTNVVIPGGLTGGSIMCLDATLDNSVMPNSNPSYTTIPTPFFCLYSAQEYNQGAVDPNTGDSLVYELVPGLEQVTTSTTTDITYISPYTAADPLAYTSGTFSFSKATGQLSFTPNMVQKALVVSKVYEYRGGKLVGTSMREMTFIVLSTCNNHSPYGKVSGVSGGTASGNTTINICKNETMLSFSINPSDTDGNKISISYAGLPAGMTIAITGNNTVSPSMALSWNISAVAAGTYYFYVTYQDDGCPLSSKQTVAYTINVLPKPSFSYALLSPANCVRKAVFKVSPLLGASPWRLTVLQGSTLVHVLSGITAAVNDSLPPGVYTLRLNSASGCSMDSSITIAAPPPIQLFNVFAKGPACHDGDDGSISIAATGGLPPYVFALGSGAYSSSGLFSGLTAGTYVVHTRDSNYCVKDTTLVLDNPPLMNISYTQTKAKCRPFANASVNFTVSGGIAPYQYGLSASSYGSASLFTGLKAGPYTFYIKDANNCVKTVDITIVDSLNVQATYAVKHVSCYGRSDAEISVSPYVGFPPFTYASGTGAYGSSSSFTALSAGTYIIHTMDVLGCIKDSAIIIRQPDPLAVSAIPHNPSCNAYSNGGVQLNGGGGTTAYTFALDGGAFTSADSFGNLAAGSYTFHLKDANGCTKDTTLTLTQPDPLMIGAEITAPACHGDQTAVVSFNASGGTPGYIYAYDTHAEQSDPVFRDLTAGGHHLFLTDKNGCKKDSAIVITEPDRLVFSDITILKPTCEAYPDGAITLSAAGGTAPYQFALNSGAFANGNVFERLQEGTYTVHVKDQQSCSAYTVVRLTGYPHILFDSAQVITPTCYGRSDGSFRLYASGGNPPLRFTLAGTDDTLAAAAFGQLHAGQYTVIISDRTDCRKEAMVTIEEPGRLHLEPVITPNDCFGLDTNGAVSLLIEGGTAPFSYLWSTGSTDSTIHGLANGTYSVRISDVNDCRDSLSAVVEYDNCCKPVIPNAFSPNNDGRNDVFYIIYKGDIVLKEFSVYNRYGQQVFTTTDITRGWDGYFNGERLEIGSYYYYIRLICGNKLDHEVAFKGDITLIR